MFKLTIDEYIERLSDLQAPEKPEDDYVLVDANEMAQWIGHQRVAELFEFAATMVSQLRPNSKRSLIPPEKRQTRELLVNINRLELIRELTTARDRINRTVNSVSS